MQKRIIRIRNLEIGAGIPKIIAPIIGRDRREVLEQAKAILEQPADSGESAPGPGRIL